MSDWNKFVKRNPHKAPPLKEVHESKESPAHEKKEHMAKKMSHGDMGTALHFKRKKGEVRF